MTLEMRDLENQERGREKLICKMLTKGKTPEEISEFCDIPLADIQKVQDQMLLDAAGIK